MMNMQFVKATKKRSKARITIDGPSGAGKTYTALIAASVLAEGGKVAVIDTERGSASLYSDKFNFDVLELDTFSPEVYTQAIRAAEAGGYNVIVIDSLSHAWEGEGGALDMVDKAAARVKGNSYVAWRNVTPLHREMVDAMLQSPAHIVTTMRSKMDYVQEKDERTGKTIIQKVGMAPIQRQGMEYEFTLVCDMDTDHKMIVSKSRCDILADAVVMKPGPDFFEKFLAWLNDGEPESNNGHKAAEPKPQPQSDPMQPPAPKLEPKSEDGIRLMPEKLKDAIEKKAVKKNGTASQQQRSLLLGMLNYCFQSDNKANEESDRKEFSKWLTGYASTKDIPDPFVLAMLDWLKPEKDAGGAYTPDPVAVREARTALSVARVDAGQQQLSI